MATTLLNTREERELMKAGSLVITRDHHDYLITRNETGVSILPIRNDIKVISSADPNIIVLNSAQMRKIENGESVEVKTRKGDFKIGLNEDGVLEATPLNPITNIILASELTR